MTWAFDVTSNIPRITQSGTDTGLSGIATAITALGTVARSTAYTTAQMVKPPAGNGMWYRCSTAGTTASTAPTYNPVLGSTTTDGTAVFTAFQEPLVRTLGTANNYYMPDVRFAINGTLTVANPQQENFVCWDVIGYACNWTSGTWCTDGVTPKWDGVHFASTRVGPDNANPVSLSLQAGAQCTFIGGEVQVAGAVGFDAATTPRTYLTRWRGTRDWGASSIRIRNYTTNAIFQDVELYDMAFDLFRMPTTAPSIKARGSEYLYQYVGAGAGGADAKFVAYNLENVDGTYDFDNYFGGWVELYNCKAGAALKVYSQYPNSSIWVKHCVPLYQDVTITAKDTAGAVVQDVRFATTDAPNNSPTVTFTTASALKTWDFRSPITYQTTTNSSGIATTSPVLNVWYWQNAFKQDLRFPSSTATYQGRAYNYKTLNVSAVLGASSAMPVSAGMIGLDTATTVTEAVALANTNINISKVGSTLVFAVTGNSTYQDIWNKYRAYISQFTSWSDTDNWTCTGKNLNTVGASILVYPGVTLSGSTNITYAYADTFKALSLADTPYLFNSGGVLQSAGVLLTTTILGVQDTYTGTGSITAVYANLTGTSTTWQFQSVTVGTSLVIYDGSGTTKYFQQEVTSAGTYNYYIPPGTTGTYYYAIEQYGKKREEGNFPANSGGILFYVPSYAEDVGISQATKATVAAYTAIDNLDKFYDFTAYKRLSESFIKLGQIATRNGTAVDIGTFYMKVNAAASSVEAIASGTITIKASALASGSKYSTIIATPPATVTPTTTETITANIEDGNGDSSVTIQGGSGNFTLWKITSSTPEADYATGTNLGNVGNVTYRFLHADGYKIVIVDNTTGYRIPVPMEKGVYTRGLFFGDQVQLAQSAEVTQINSKVDVLQTEVGNIMMSFDVNTDSLHAISDAVDLIPTNVLGATVETGATLAESLRLANAVLGGLVSGGGSGTETFRSLNDDKDRLISSNDAQGNRTVEIRDLT